jgi:hypothetical protein
MAFNGRFILNVAHFASKLGGDYAETIHESGISETDLAKEDGVVDDDTYNKVLEKLVSGTGDLYFGLHAGENLNIAAAGSSLRSHTRHKLLRRPLNTAVSLPILAAVHFR